MEISKNHKCADHMALISYKWNNKDNSVTYVYMCKICNKVEERVVHNSEGLVNMFNGSEMYNKYNL